MAEFITKCLHCNSDLQVQDEWVGMEVECPQCRQAFVISKPAPPLVIVNAGSALPPNGKNCPFCGNIIHTQATVCNFCKRNLAGAPNHCAGNENSAWRKWIKKPYFCEAAIAAGVIILLMFGSGVFCVVHDNYCIGNLNLEERFEAYQSESAMGDDHEFSLTYFVLDNIASFMRGFFFCYGGAVLDNDDRLMDKVLFRHGVSDENAREAMIKTIDIWYAAKE